MLNQLHKHLQNDAKPVGSVIDRVFNYKTMVQELGPIGAMVASTGLRKYKKVDLWKAVVPAAERQ